MIATMLRSRTSCWTANISGEKCPRSGKSADSAQFMNHSVTRRERRQSTCVPPAGLAAVINNRYQEKEGEKKKSFHGAAQFGGVSQLGRKDGDHVTSAGKNISKWMSCKEGVNESIRIMSDCVCVRNDLAERYWFNRAGWWTSWAPV